MPLTKCVECDSEVPNEVFTCPECGHPVGLPPRSPGLAIGLIALAAVVGVLGAAVGIGVLVYICSGMLLKYLR
jgi:hypothetical protein